MLDWTVEEDEPMELYLKYKGKNIAKFNLDDAPLLEWNTAMRMLARKVADILNTHTILNDMIKKEIDD
jgi:hypothetical protein